MLTWITLTISKNITPGISTELFPIRGTSNDCTNSSLYEGMPPRLEKVASDRQRRLQRAWYTCPMYIPSDNRRLLLHSSQGATIRGAESNWGEIWLDS